MALATMTTKGQVTIPKDVRESLHLHSGDKIEIVISKAGEAVMRPIITKVDDMFCKLKTDKKTVSVEEMNQILKQKFKKESL
jgi:antitoxin PrlF